jgi:hypothetical protein
MDRYAYAHVPLCYLFPTPSVPLPPSHKGCVLYVFYPPPFPQLLILLCPPPLFLGIPLPLPLPLPPPLPLTMQCDTFRGGYGRYYLEGLDVFMDDDEEWLFDSATQRIRRTVAPTSAQTIRARVNEYGLVINETSHLVIANLSVFGSIISVAGNVTNVRLQSIDFNYSAVSRRAMGDVTPPATVALFNPATCFPNQWCGARFHHGFCCVRVSIIGLWHGARFSAGDLHSRILLDLMLFLRLKRCHACDQCHSSRASTFLPVHTVNCVQTLKASTFAGQAPPLLIMNSATTLRPNTEGLDLCRPGTPLLIMNSATTLRPNTEGLDLCRPGTPLLTMDSITYIASKH